MHVLIIGGGAAGFFSALSVKEHFPESEVTILEKSLKILAKVKVSGGGRCNVTHACFDNVALSKYYPRGEKYLRKAFEEFNAQSTIDWFKKRNIILETLPDNCIFPKSNSSQTIIDCFVNEAIDLGIKVQLQSSVKSISKNLHNQFLIQTNDSEIIADKVIVTIGGQPKRNGLEWLENLGHKIV